MSRKLLEIIAYNAADCRLAQEAGADRIELCANPAEGGTTPSAGMILLSRQLTTLPLYCMIRPRGGDFVYSDTELRVMLADIACARAEGCNGLVMGMLTPAGEIDQAALDQLLRAAAGTPVTFHRAFDRARDPEAALEILIERGVSRVLTSGGASTATEGANSLKRLVQQAAGRIVIMPGGGVRHTNLRELYELSGASEFHSSASCVPGPGERTNESYTMLDTSEVNKCRAILDQLPA